MKNKYSAGAGILVLCFFLIAFAPAGHADADSAGEIVNQITKMKLHYLDEEKKRLDPYQPILRINNILHDVEKKLGVEFETRKDTGFGERIDFSNNGLGFTVKMKPGHELITVSRKLKPGEKSSFYGRGMVFDIDPEEGTWVQLKAEALPKIVSLKSKKEVLDYITSLTFGLAKGYFKLNYFEGKEIREKLNLCSNPEAQELLTPPNFEEQGNEFILERDLLVIYIESPGTMPPERDQNHYFKDKRGMFVRSHETVSKDGIYKFETKTILMKNLMPGLCYEAL